MTWLLFAVLDLLMKLVNVFLAPFLPLFASENGWLPKWLSWFQTDDNSLDGDSGWKTEHYVGWPRYLKRVLWLYRNPTYGFARTVCGFQVQPGFKYLCNGDEAVSNLPLTEGKVFRTITNPDGSIAWQWYYVKAWPGKTKCLRINLGWKVWGHKQAGDTCSLTFSINPIQLCREK